MTESDSAADRARSKPGRLLTGRPTLQQLTETQTALRTAAAVAPDAVTEPLATIRILTEVLEALEPTGALDKPATDQALSAWQEVQNALRRLRVAARAVEERDAATNSIRREMDHSEQRLRESIGKFVESVRAELLPATAGSRAAALRVLDRAAEWLDARSLVQETRGARDDAVEAVIAARRAAGVAGETALGAHFGRYADRERRAANILRLACIAALLSLSGLAALAIIDSSDATWTSTEQFARFGVAVPLAVLAAYLGRESSRHRTGAQWAEELQVKLLTLDAFVEPLTDEQVNSLRVGFGRNLFLVENDGPVAVPSDAGPSALSETARLLEQTADLVRTASQNRSASDG